MQHWALLLAAIGQQEPLTFEAARTLPPQEVERRVFEGVRGTTREVVAHDLFGNMYRSYQRAEFSIDFADAPKPTPMPGLCSVQVRTAVFGRGYEPNAGKEAPTHLLEVTEQTRYAVQLSGTNPPSIADAPCLPAPVIGNARYFQVWGYAGQPAHSDFVIIAVRILQGMIRDAADKRSRAMIACTEDMFAALGGSWDPLCADAAQSVAKLRWDGISSLQVRPCESERVCIEAYFRRPVARRDASTLVKLSVEVKGAKDKLISGRDDGQLMSVALLGVTAVD